MIDHTRAASAIAELEFDDVKRYTDYWQGIAPQTDEEHFWRWVFAFLSVHTSWKANLVGYKLLRKHWSWMFDKVKLRARVIESKVGLIERRVDGIWKFKEDFWQDPKSWQWTDGDWIQFRDSLAARCYGLGLAKSAFALEMCYPDQCEAVCLDTHMIQLYGFEPSEVNRASKGSTYKNLETHWVTNCQDRSVPSYIARNIFWDKNQSQTDCRYWSHVFE